MLSGLRNVAQKAEAAKTSIDKVSASAAGTLARFNTTIGLVVTVVFVLISYGMRSFIPSVKKVRGMVVSAADQRALRYFPDATITTFTKVVPKNHGFQGGWFTVSTNSNGQKTVKMKRITFPNGQTLECHYASMHKPWPVDLASGKVYCQTKYWNRCQMKVDYNDTIYTVEMSHNDACDMQGKELPFFYDAKADKLWTWNIGIIRTIFGWVSFLLSLSAIQSVFMLYILLLTGDDGKYWAENYKIPEEIQKKMPEYSKMWTKAFMWDRAENVQKAAAKLARQAGDLTGGPVGNIAGQVAEGAGDLAATHSSFMKTKTDISLGTRLWRTVTTGSEENAGAHWVAYLQRRMLIFVCSTVVTTFFVDTILDNTYTTYKNSLVHRLATLAPSFIVGILVARVVLVFDLARLRGKIVEDLIRDGSADETLRKRFSRFGTPRLVL